MTIEHKWYWDRRTNKAYRPVATGDGTVTLLSVWHEDEVAGAIETGALDDVENIGEENQGFDHFESFRFLEEEQIERYEAAGRGESSTGDGASDVDADGDGDRS